MKIKGKKYIKYSPSREKGGGAVELKIERRWFNQPVIRIDANDDFEAITLFLDAGEARKLRAVLEFKIRSIEPKPSFPVSVRKRE